MDRHHLTNSSESSHVDNRLLRDGPCGLVHRKGEYGLGAGEGGVGCKQKSSEWVYANREEPHTWNKRRSAQGCHVIVRSDRAGGYSSRRGTIQHTAIR